MKHWFVLLTTAAAITAFAPTMSNAQVDVRVPGVGVRVGETLALTVANNQFVDVDSTAAIHDSTRYTFIRNTNVSAQPPPARSTSLSLPRELKLLAPKMIAKGWMPSRTDSSLARRPRSAIIVDDWGPYDYRSPKLWPVDSSRQNPLHLRVLGPSGKWTVVTQRGIAALSLMSGRVGDTITVTPKPDSVGDWSLALEYVGQEVVSPRGVTTNRGEPYEFTYTRFEPPIDWVARFYQWTDSSKDPRKNPDAFTTLHLSPPVLTSRLSRLDYEGYRAIPGVSRENFALEAIGFVDLAPGEYTLRTISDDGVRVWIDGVLAIDDWRAHESALDFARLAGGHHDLRVQYYQGDGYYELKLDIVRGRERSPGSPGAHGS